jgi:hypothetical protein
MHKRIAALSVAAVAAAVAATPALAQNSKGGGGGSTSGVILIDQTKAEAGGVTAGDGYAGPATATGNVLKFTQTPFQQVVQMGPNMCDGLLCQ